jgi:hypothetical protein
MGFIQPFLFVLDPPFLFFLLGGFHAILFGCMVFALLILL